MNTQQLDVLKKRLKVASAELKMRERNRNASEKGYRRVLKLVEELQRKIDDGRNSLKGT